MDKKELYRLLAEKDAQFEKAKRKRSFKTILAFSIVFFVLFCYQLKPSGLDYIGCALISVLVGGVHFIVNAPIYSYLVLQGEAERKYLEDLRKKLYPEQEDI